MDDDQIKDDAADEGAEDDDLDLDLDDDAADDGKDDAGKGKDGDDDRKSETPEARRARLARQLDRHDKKHGLGKYGEDGKPKAPSKSSKDTKSGELDFSQRAFLNSEGIKGKSEQALVQEWMKDTGKSLDAVIENPRFQAELKDFREGNATKDAMPKGTRRSSQTSRDSVEYWIAKGELPPNTPENQELRRKVVNAKIETKKDRDVFTKTPVIGG
jgi:hypothetical protein